MGGLFFSLYNNGEIGDYGCQRSNCCQQWGQQQDTSRSSYADRERKFDQVFTFLGLDDNAANVAFRYQLFDFSYGFIRSNLVFFCPTFFVAYVTLLILN